MAMISSAMVSVFCRTPTWRVSLTSCCLINFEFKQELCSMPEPRNFKSKSKKHNIIKYTIGRVGGYACRIHIHEYTNTHTHTHTHVYIPHTSAHYASIRMCVRSKLFRESCRLRHAFLLAVVYIWGKIVLKTAQGVTPLTPFPAKRRSNTASWEAGDCQTGSRSAGHVHAAVFDCWKTSASEDSSAQAPLWSIKGPHRKGASREPSQKRMEPIER